MVKFRTEIQPLLEKYCYDCHGDGSDKGGVRLDIFDTKEALHNHELWLRAMRNVRAGIMPPPDTDQLSKEEIEKLVTWIKREGMELDPAKPDPGRATVRRLNRIEYRNTVRDLLGVDFDTAKEFPADDTGHGFDNMGDVLTISPLLMEKYLDAAQTIIGRAVVTAPKMIAEKPILGRQFTTVRADTRLPAPAAPAPAAPAADPVAAAAAVVPPAAAPAPAVAAANPSPAAAPAAGAPGVTPPVPGAPGAPAAVAGQPPAAAGRGALVAGRGGRQGGAGRGGRGGPPPVTRPEPTVEADTIVLSYYTPALVSAKQTLEHAGKYQISLDFIAQETYADDLFDLNKAQVVFAIDGKPLLDQEFVREGYGKKFEFTFDQELAAGEREFTMEIKPIGPETPQYRRLRIRLNQVVVRGPLAPEYWAKTPGYDKYFTRETVPADAAGRRAYAREILEKFATRAFRAPVPATTLDDMVTLAERVAARPTQTFETGVAQAMVAVLASPSFIFREDRSLPLQAGQTHPFVDEFSLATRLSYFFWSSMPDEELFNLAKEGKLRANLAAQVKRMLADPRSQELVRNFTGQWLQARDIATIQINPLDVFLRDHPNPEYEQAKLDFARLAAIPAGSRTPEDTQALARARQLVNTFERSPKPTLTESLRAAMRQETELSFDHILREDRSFLELLNSDYTFLNEELAKHYGIEGVTGANMRKVALPSDSPRGGVLTQGTVLTVTSNPTRTSPVKRGVFILEAILAAPPPPPPPNIPPLEDAGTPEEIKNLTLRETMALHAKSTACASCHLRMDPLGLALENFNAMGQFRTAEGDHPVDPSGVLINGESFKSVQELKKILVTSHRKDFYHSVAEKLLTYALGRGLEYYDTDTLDGLVDKLEASGGLPSALIEGIIDSAPFQQRRRTTPGLAEETSLPAAPRVVQAQP